MKGKNNQNKSGGNKYGPGNGTGNNGVGPKDGTGNGSGNGTGTCDGTGPVSYTHLDVYKRQGLRLTSIGFA